MALPLSEPSQHPAVSDRALAQFRNRYPGKNAHACLAAFRKWLADYGKTADIPDIAMKKSRPLVKCIVWLTVSAALTGAARAATTVLPVEAAAPTNSSRKGYKSGRKAARTADAVAAPTPASVQR